MIPEDGSPELYKALASCPPRHRAERMRSLGLLALSMMKNPKTTEVSSPVEEPVEVKEEASQMDELTSNMLGSLNNLQD